MLVNLSKIFHVCRVSVRVLSAPYDKSSLCVHKHLINNCVKLYCSKVELPNCNVGTIGHVDHGKTTLTSAITKYAAKTGQAKYVAYDQIDQAPAEKARGITINIAHVGYRTKNRQYSHTDCPGHADFVKNMISGASQMDGAVVVVAATDGPMPQTREHLFLCQQIGVKDLIVFINKADLIDADTMELVEIEMAELLEFYGFTSGETPMIRGSALLALNEDTSEFGEPCIKKLLDTMDSHFKIPERKLDAPFMMPIDNAILVPGRGAVLVGTIQQGTVKKNDAVNLIGFDEVINTSIGDMQVFRQSVTKAVAGDHIGALCRGIKAKRVKKGMILCKGNNIQLTNVYHASLYILSSKEGGRSKPIKCSFCADMFSHTWNCHVRIDFPSEKEFLMPGDYASVRLTLLFKMFMPIGETFTLREKNVTIASGKITKSLDPAAVPYNKLGSLKLKVESSDFNE